MMSAVKRIIPSPLRQFIKLIIGSMQWHRRNYAAPSPSLIKQRVLLRNGVPAATWVETGTYLGDTSAFLSKHAVKVLTIEPAQALFERARKRFSQSANVQVINGTSERVFPELLPTLSGNVNFWLDGHYSGGDTWITFQGSSDTPIVDELAQIERNLSKYDQLCVLVDDIRSFQSSTSDSAYPKLDYLVDWARRNSLNWHIEHDIFVAKRATVGRSSGA